MVTAETSAIPRSAWRASMTARVCMGAVLTASSIALYSITRLHRHQRRRDHLARDPQRGQLPVEHVPRRPRFIAHAQPSGGLAFLHQAADRLRPIGDDPKASDITVRLRDRDRN